MLLEIGSYSVAQKGLKLVAAPCLSIPSAGIIGLQQLLVLFWRCKGSSPVPPLRHILPPSVLGRAGASRGPNKHKNPSCFSPEFHVFALESCWAFGDDAQALRLPAQLWQISLFGSRWAQRTYPLCSSLEGPGSCTLDSFVCAMYGLAPG